MNLELAMMRKNWESGFTHGKMKMWFGLTDEQEFLITYAFDNGYLNTDIRLALDKVQSGMLSAELIELLEDTK